MARELNKSRTGAAMAAPRIPDWKVPPEPVQIKCTVIRDSGHPGELIVQFESKREKYTAFVPDFVVDRERQTIYAYIVAEVDPDAWLVDLPAETLTTGPRIRVDKDEEGKLLLIQNGT